MSAGGQVERTQVHPARSHRCVLEICTSDPSPQFRRTVKKNRGSYRLREFKPAPLLSNEGSFCHANNVVILPVESLSWLPISETHLHGAKSGDDTP